MRISAPVHDNDDRGGAAAGARKGQGASNATTKKSKGAKAASKPTTKPNAKPKVDGRKSCVIEMKNVDENGSSVAMTRNLSRDAREAVREMRGDWRFYSLATYCLTFRACHGLPTRTCADFERALCDPSTSANDWLVELLLRLLDGEGDDEGRAVGSTTSMTFSVDDDWEERLDRTSRELEQLYPEEFPDGPPIDSAVGKNFFDVDPLTRMDVLFTLCERKCETSRIGNEAAAAHAIEYERAQRRKVFVSSSCESQLHGAPIGYDFLSRAYYVCPGSYRIFRAAKVAVDDFDGPDPPEWCTPCVTFEEVSKFTSALSKSGNKNEQALFEYLHTKHLPSFREKMQEQQAEAERLEAKRKALQEAEAKRAYLLSVDRKRSSRLVIKEEEQRKKIETVERGMVPAKPSDEEINKVRSDIRSWILQPKRLRPTSVPHGIDIRQILATDDCMPPIKKPKGREWKNKCVCVYWDADDGVESTFYDAIVWDYDSMNDKASVFYTETQTMERINLEFARVRVGGPAPKGIIDGKRGLLIPYANMMRMVEKSMQKAREAFTWGGTWIENIVSAGVPAYAEGSMLCLRPPLARIEDEDTFEAEADEDASAEDCPSSATAVNDGDVCVDTSDSINDGDDVDADVVVVENQDSPSPKKSRIEEPVDL